MEKGAVNAQTLPRIAIGGMFIFAIGLLLEGLFPREKKELVITLEVGLSVDLQHEVPEDLLLLRVHGGADGKVVHAGEHVPARMWGVHSQNEVNAMKLRYNTEIISGAVFAVVGAVLWLLIPSQIQTMEKGAVNAQTLPRA